MPPHIGEKAEILHTRGPAQTVTPSGSPYTYIAPSDGGVMVTGGTVTLLEYGRHSTFVSVGLLAGSARILRGDSIRVTYAVAPTITFMPD